MPNYLDEYKIYYQLRMLRYEGNPDYPNSYQSEKQSMKLLLPVMCWKNLKTNWEA